MKQNLLDLLDWFKNLFKKEVVAPVQVIEPSRVRPTVPRDFELKKGMRGVDISHHNTDVDLEVLVKNVDFIYMKATEGENFVSNVYEKRALILNTLDIPWGAYHYYRVNKDPIEQAQHFLKHIDKTSGLPPVLDIEAINNDYDSEKHTASLIIFLERIEEVTGIRPMIYTSFYFARDVIKPTEEFARYPLWIAHYTRRWEKVRCPKPWSQIKMWQYSEYNIDEIKGAGWRLDLNKVMS